MSTVTIPSFLLMLPVIYLGMGVLMYYPLCRHAAKGFSRYGYTAWDIATVRRANDDWGWFKRIGMTPVQFVMLVVAWPFALKDELR